MWFWALPRASVERGTENEIFRARGQRPLAHFPLLVYAYDPKVCLFLAPHFVYTMPLDEFDTLSSWSVVY